MTDIIPADAPATAHTEHTEIIPAGTPAVAAVPSGEVQAHEATAVVIERKPRGGWLAKLRFGSTQKTGEGVTIHAAIDDALTPKKGDTGYVAPAVPAV